MQRSRPSLGPRWLPVALVGIVLAACGSDDGAGTAATVRSQPSVVAPTATETTPPVTSLPSSTTSSSTTTTLPDDPWNLEAPPLPPAVVPQPGFEAMADVDTVCIRFQVDDRTAASGRDKFTEILGALGYTVVESGCAATFVVTLAGEAGPASYSGDLTCYLNRVVGGTLEFLVADQQVASWAIDEFDNAPMTTTTYSCPGPDDQVAVQFWTRSLYEVLYEVYGHLGLAAYEVTDDRELSLRILDTDEQRAAFLADPVVMQLFASYFGTRPLTPDQLLFVEAITASIEQQGGVPPAGVEILLPHLLRSVTDDDADARYPEYWLDGAWDAIAWITGIADRDPSAAWAWYEGYVR